MAHVTVPALKPLTYQGRSYVRGELVTMPAIEAAARSRRGEVSLVKGKIIAPEPVQNVAAMAAEDSPEPRTIRRRTPYRRRDMTVPTESAE